VLSEKSIKILSISEYMRMKLARDAKEFYLMGLSQSDFSRFCPVAAKKFDLLAAAEDGKPLFGESLGTLGRFIYTACRQF
jgi:hypothetical protein